MVTESELLKFRRRIFKYFALKVISDLFLTDLELCILLSEFSE